MRYSENFQGLFSCQTQVIESLEAEADENTADKLEAEHHD